MENPGFGRELSQRGKDFLFPCILIAVSLILLWSGLSIRSLWGPEGRWAEIVKEMIRSHNYFWPTINGEVYFDKPLLSYWLMVASVRVGGLNEMMLRVPGVLAAAGTLFMIFLIGRRLFSARTGLLAALMLITSPMFLFWSRIASAELLNTFSIWVMYWAFLAACSQPRKVYFVLLYGVGATACFLKGPIAPALSFFTIILFSAAEAGLEMSRSSVEKRSMATVLSQKFFWLLSRQALPGLVIGSLIFVVLLALPVLFTKSWISGILMWKENVVRFFSPFDHKDPPHAYAYAIALFSAPWTFCMLGSLSRFRMVKESRSHFWAYGSTLAIFLFFLLSGSRRSYYILPLIPALALITAESIQAWIEGKGSEAELKTISIANVATIALLFCLGAGFFFVYLFITPYRHGSEPILGAVTIAGSFASLLLFRRQKRAQVISLLIALVVIVDFWGVTLGATIGERGRTVREFACQAGMLIDKVGKENVALFRECTAELLFYLNTDAVIESVASAEEAEEFRRRHPQGVLVLDLNDVSPHLESYVRTLKPLLVQQVTRKKGERFAVMQYP